MIKRSTIMHRIHQGFTLIELLVVISIIALLIALLLPQLARARGVATRISCMSMYRSLNFASITYAGDSKDAVPWLCAGSNQTVLGLGGPGNQAQTTTEILAKFSLDYLNASFGWDAARSRIIVPKALVDPGLFPEGSIRPYATGMVSVLQEIGQNQNSWGNVIGFGSFLGMYYNNTSVGRTLNGSNGGINARYRQRDPAYSGGVGNGQDLAGLGLARLRYQEMLNPSEDVLFLDLNFCSSTSGATAANWSSPHAFGNKPEGANQGYADGSVRFYGYSQFNYAASMAANWNYNPAYTPYRVDLTKPTLFSKGGYPSAQTGFQSTTPDWYGVTDPNRGGGFTP